MRLLWIMIIVFVACNRSIAPEQAAEVSKLVSDQRFVFKAQSANPLRGRTIQLTTDYDLRITKDSIVAYLPYYGRVTSPTYPVGGGLTFTSTNFRYNTTTGAKGWEVIIEPQDVTDVRHLQLNITQGGSATLNVISTSRDAISFYGRIAASL